MLISLLGLLLVLIPCSIAAHSALVAVREGRLALACVAGLGIAMALIAVALKISPWGLAVTSWMIVGVAACVVATLAGRYWWLGRGVPGVPAWRVDSPTSAIGLLLAVHLILILLNDIGRPVFPWDAFTTWLYRAKAWVMADGVLPVISPQQWMTTGSDAGLPVHAYFYPEFLSLFVAFAVSLAGDWSPESAGLPWFLLALALVALMYGLLRQLACSHRTSLLGAYLLLSLPFMGVHLAVVGYADAWMALFSGGGLAGLMVWSIRRSATLISLSLALLALGTQIKLEGWLWLAMGVAFLVLLLASQRTRPWWVAAGVALMGLLCALSGVTAIDLGAFGRFGIVDGMLQVGPLGEYGLRLFNPTAKYGQLLFMRPGFSLLAAAYLVSLAILVSRRHPIVAPVIWMTLLIGGAQFVIFGLSSYSLYAESGTAIARVLLQFMPVFVVMVVLPLAHGSTDQLAQGSARQSSGALGERAPIRYALGLPLIAVIVAWLGSSWSGAGGQTNTFHSSDLDVVVGQGVSSGNALMLNNPVGSAAVITLPFESAESPRTRYAAVNVSGAPDVDVMLFWRNDAVQAPVHTYPVSGGMPSLIDLSGNPAWAPERVIELGMIVPEPAFDRLQIHSVSLATDLTLAQRLREALDALSPLRLTQRTLNALPRVGGLGSNTSTVFVVAFGLLLVLTVVVAYLSSLRFLSALAPAVLGLWLASDALWLARFGGMTTALYSGAEAGVADSGAYLEGPATRVSDLLGGSEAVLVLPLTAADDFAAQKLPFLILPRRAAFLPVLDTTIPADWTGDIVLVGDDSEIQAQRVEELQRLTGREYRLVGRAASYAVLRVVGA